MSLSRKHTLSAVLLFVLCTALVPQGANATLLGTFFHTYGFGTDPNAVQIDLRYYDGQPGGKYLWEYTVTNNSYDPNPGVSNGFSGFELFLPSPIPEISGISPNPGSTPPWEIDCCSGNPTEWDIRNSVGNGVMPGQNLIFSFLTNPRPVATNDSGWFHTWQFDTQTDIVFTTGSNQPFALVATASGPLHVPWVPGLTPIPEPATLALVAIGVAGLAAVRRRKVQAE